MFQARARALGSGVTYPLGEDRFEIDHGDDYFAFFDRLGELSYLAAVDGDELVGALAVVARDVPGSSGTALRPAWYACDLKVRPDRRGLRVPAQLFAAALSLEHSECTRCYAISMDPGDGSANRVERLLARLPVTPMSRAVTLHLYSLDDLAMRSALPLVERTRGPVSFLSLAGKKDIVLASTGLPMQLLHAQFGPCAEESVFEPRPNSVHMFCTPKNDALDVGLRDQGHRPSATAAVLHHRMEDQDWSFVLTSDI